MSLAHAIITLGFAAMAVVAGWLIIPAIKDAARFIWEISREPKDD